MSTIVAYAGPGRETGKDVQRRLRKHVRDARLGVTTSKIRRLYDDDMIDLTAGK